MRLKFSGSYFNHLDVTAIEGVTCHRDLSRLLASTSRVDRECECPRASACFALHRVVRLLKKKSPRTILVTAASMDKIGTSGREMTLRRKRLRQSGVLGICWLMGSRGVFMWLSCLPLHCGWKDHSRDCVILLI